MSGPEHIGAIVERVVRDMDKERGITAHEMIEVADGEIARLRQLMFEAYANCYRFGDCTGLDDRDGAVTYEEYCRDCDWCASDRCDIDGWKIPE